MLINSILRPRIVTARWSIRCERERARDECLDVIDGRPAVGQPATSSDQGPPCGEDQRSRGRTQSVLSEHSSVGESHRLPEGAGGSRDVGRVILADRTEKSDSSGDMLAGLHPGATVRATPRQAGFEIADSHTRLSARSRVRASSCSMAWTLDSACIDGDLAGAVG